MPHKVKPPLLATWASMKSRCNNPLNPHYKNYGERGIKVCSRWDTYRQFESDMGPKPTPLHTLERIDVNGDYSPENCRWATRKEQQRNRRTASYVTIEGKQYRTIELAERSGLKSDTIIGRAKAGLALDEVLSPAKRVFRQGLELGGFANGRRLRAMTHCKNGHAFDEANTYVTKEGWRSCRRCHADRQWRR
jgi:hypothetical protein